MHSLFDFYIRKSKQRRRIATTTACYWRELCRWTRTKASRCKKRRKWCQGRRASRCRCKRASSRRTTAIRWSRREQRNWRKCRKQKRTSWRRKVWRRTKTSCRRKEWRNCWRFKNEENENDEEGTEEDNEESKEETD